VGLAGSELVGLMPAGAATAAAGAMLRIDGFDASHVLELRLLDEEARLRSDSGTDTARDAG
jgi:glutamate formiminotransferase